MIATEQEPKYTPVTMAGKTFAALLAFFLVGTANVALTFFIGSTLGTLLRAGLNRL